MDNFDHLMNDMTGMVPVYMIMDDAMRDAMWYHLIYYLIRINSSISQHKVQKVDDILPPHLIWMFA